MSTIDRLRELMRNNRSAARRSDDSHADEGSLPPVSASHRSGDERSEPAQSHDFAPPSVSRSAAGGGLRELVYEPVDEAGLPMPSRDEAPALPGASLLETPVGRCFHIDYLFEADRSYGQVRVEDGCVSPADVIGFCEAQTLARDAAAAQRAAGGGASGASGGYWAGASLSLQQDLGVLEADGPVMFLDLETTGLSGGAGTVAFLVGIGFFENGAFRTRQFLLPGFASERALLHAVAECLGDAGCLVTYNGKTFDLPVMETRWLFHRQPLAWTDLAHLDMLHVSRRLWRARGDDPEASCRLVFLERDLFGVERVGDVPGIEIPARYFDYIRYGDAAQLEPVLHHNRLDLLSLALLTARAIRLIREAVAERAPIITNPQERLAVGRELMRLHQRSAAEACFRTVAECATAPDSVRSEALYSWARLLRRARRHQEAVDVWRRLANARTVRAVLRAEAQEALAIHYEHRDRDLEAAQQWATGALIGGAGARHRTAVNHRLARLRRKITVQKESGPETASYLPW
jgi:uncharacterized protein YprB with RNaseH-like and TPR domain